MTVTGAMAMKKVDLGEHGWGEILEDKDNKLIGRREIVMILHHEGKSTPMRITLRMKVAEVFGVDVKRVYVRNIQTEYGIGRSRVRIHIYNNVERALQFEPKHIIERNGGVDPLSEG